MIIRTGQQTDFTDHLIQTIEHCADIEYSPVEAYKGDTLLLIPQRDLIRVYTENRKLAVIAESGLYDSRQTLKELEEKLDRDHFVRISRFEIINLRKVSGFDFSSTGTIRVLFVNGSETWVARRYVQTIQQVMKQRGSQKEGMRND